MKFPAGRGEVGKCVLMSSGSSFLVGSHTRSSSPRSFAMRNHARPCTRRVGGYWYRISVMPYVRTPVVFCLCERLCFVSLPCICLVSLSVCVMLTATRPSYAPGLRNAGPDAQGHTSRWIVPRIHRGPSAPPRVILV